MLWAWGQERYHSLAPMYYRDAMAAIVVYDITNKESFESLSKWNEQVTEFGSEDIIRVVIANKSDLAAPNPVPSEDGRKFAADNSMSFFSTSATLAAGTEEAFQQIVDQCTALLDQKAEQNRRALSAANAEGAYLNGDGVDGGDRTIDQNASLMNRV